MSLNRFLQAAKAEQAHAQLVADVEAGRRPEAELAVRPRWIGQRPTGGLLIRHGFRDASQWAEHPYEVLCLIRSPQPSPPAHDGRGRPDDPRTDHRIHPRGSWLRRAEPSDFEQPSRLQGRF